MNSARFRNLGAGAVSVTVIALGLVLAPTAASALVQTTEALAPGATATTMTPGQTSKPAASVTVTFSNSYGSGDKFTLQIEPNGAANPSAAKSVVFASKPGVSLAGGTTGDTIPTFTTALASSASGIGNDEFVITMLNASGGVPLDNWTFTITGIAYNVGASVGAPSPQPYPIDLAASYTASGSTAQAASGSPVTNADVLDFTMTEPAVGVPEGSTANPLPALSLTELIGGAFAPGAYTIAPSGSSPLNSGSLTGTATVSATGLTVAAVPSNGNCPAAGGSSSVNVAVGSNGQFQFCLVSPSTTTPGSLTVTGMGYTPPSALGPIPIKVTDGANSNTYQATQPAITVLLNPRIAGTTADDTAATAAESLYSSAMNNGQGGAVILASDSEYQDALSASFLGHTALPYQNVVTGATANMSGSVPILLNPVNPPSGGESTTAAAGAITKLGASTAYVIGGTAVISATVVSQLQKIQVGTSPSGAAEFLQVVRVAGITAENTAADVATYQSLSNIPATPGAYGMYNDGASESGSGPSSGSVPTAILADADEFQDALAASPLAYAFSIPVLLNAGGQGLDASAAQAFAALGIKQVIIVGGSGAVSDQVVTDLAAKGISALRVAGQTFDATAANLALFMLNNFTSAGKADGLAATAAEDGGSSLTLGTARGDAYQDALSASQVLGNVATTAVSPLLLNTNTSTLSAGAGLVLSGAGTGPAGGLTVYNSSGTASVEHILGDVVFGGTLAQTPALVTQELNTIAAG